VAEHNQIGKEKQTASLIGSHLTDCIMPTKLVKNVLITNCTSICNGDDFIR